MAAAAAFLALERKVAIAAVQRACRVCEHVRTSAGNQTVTKDDSSPVTVADFAAQAVVFGMLAAEFPSDPCVGEESAEVLRSQDANGAALREKIQQAVAVAEHMSVDAILSSIDRGSFEGGKCARFWTLDPIDGTKGFLRNDQYAVALSLVIDGKPVLGVLGCPNLPVSWKAPEGERGCIFVAVAGQGSYMLTLSHPETETRISVTAETTTDASTVLESFEAGHTAHDISATIQQALSITKPPVRMDSQAKYGALARGDGSIYLRLPRIGKPYEEKIWDHAAGVVVIQEAGGRVTDAAGRELDFALGRTLKANAGVVATNGPIHDAVIKAVTSAFAAAGGPLA